MFQELTDEFYYVDDNYQFHPICISILCFYEVFFFLIFGTHIGFSDIYYYAFCFFYFLLHLPSLSFSLFDPRSLMGICFFCG